MVATVAEQETGVGEAKWMRGVKWMCDVLVDARVVMF
tara:strand:+ start:2391 stop:2501 length:111 start_codon:yes stop_codon:yes gene_type:complete